MIKLKKNIDKNHFQERGGFMETPLCIALCEDQIKDADLILDYISKSDIKTKCSHFFSGKELLANFYPHKYDIIFFDIYMEEIKGIDAAKKIREIDSDVIIAFTTSSIDYTLESYRLGALKYIEKPVNFRDVNETLELSYARRKASPKVSVSVKGKNQYISIDKILYIEQKGHNIILNTFSKRIYSDQRIKISDMENLFSCPPFFRCHHSFLVNLKYVKSLDKELRIFTMLNDDVVYIRRQDIRKAQEAYENQLFSAARGE